MAADRRIIRDIIIRRIEVDIAKGLLPSDTRPTTLAEPAIAVTQSMSFLALDGADRASLTAVAEMAHVGWGS